MKSSLPFLPLIAAALVLCAGCEVVPVPKARPGSPAKAAPVSGLVAVAPDQTLDPALLKPTADAFRLGPGDRVEIEIMGDPSTRSTVTVGPDGKIYYYILPGIDVWGRTIAETREQLGNGLQRYLREKPVVAVSLRESASQRVWVLGRVNTPGVYTLSGPTTLLAAVSQAGGLSAASAGAGPAALLAQMSGGGGGGDSADLSRSFVMRQGKVLPVNFEKLLREGDLSQNIYLMPDDFLFLPAVHSAEVYVLGAVARPQAQKMSGAVTVAQAVAMVGGTIPDAYCANVAIVRGSLNDPQIAIVDLNDIVHGKAPDMRLEAGDIVYVPFTPYRILTRYANLILDTFARTVGVNAGAHAAGGNVSPVGVSIR